MLLEDIMRNHSNALSNLIRGKIEPEEFVRTSLDFIEMYVDSVRELNIDEVVVRIREHKYCLSAIEYLRIGGIQEIEQHLELARWLYEFFLKFYLFSQIEGMEGRLHQVRKALESGPFTTLVEIKDVFNVVVGGSRIKGAEKYLMNEADRRALDYYLDAQERYRRNQLTNAR